MGASKISAIGLSPNYHNDQTVIIGLTGKGLFLSVDGGEHFSRVGADVLEGYDAPTIIRFSPAYALDRTVHAASLEEIFMSVDGGKTWSGLSWAGVSSR